MNSPLNKRRRFIKAGLAASILANIPWHSSIASPVPADNFQVPKNIHDELVRLYGDQANNITTTDKLQMKTPDIAENGAVIPVSILGEKGLVSSMALFVARNPKTLAARCKLHEGADLPVSLRVKSPQSSDLYLVAQTENGLVGIMKNVKVTIGCGGF